MTTTVDTPKKGFPGLAQLQRIGRSLMLPIAALPAAALMLRLGQPDMLGADGAAGSMPWLQPVADVLAKGGDALFANLPLLFAVGVAVGYARKSDGSTGLAAVVGYFVFKFVSDGLSPYVLGAPAEGESQQLINYGVLGGIVMGLVTALLYQRFSRIKLPPYLAFFGGRRFVPIITSFVAILVAVIGALAYPAFNSGLTALGTWVTSSTILGGFVYGFANRILVPIGLHHLLNSLPWFQFGEYTDAAGDVWHGDIARFLHGDPTAGAFMTGFFPIMMFALPAAAFAIAHAAKPANRKAIMGIMGSAALVSFVTGVTEPLEFAFVFVAYPLYLVHAVLTGTSLALVNALGIRDGFGFSAGAIDYLLNFRIAEKPLLLIVIGLVYAVIYYFLFRWAIKKWNLRTPGNEPEGEVFQDASADAFEVAPAAVAATPAATTAGAGSAADTPVASTSPSDGGAAPDTDPGAGADTPEDPSKR